MAFFGPGRYSAGLEEKAETKVTLVTARGQRLAAFSTSIQDAFSGQRAPEIALNLCLSFIFAPSNLPPKSFNHHREITFLPKTKNFLRNL